MTADLTQGPIRRQMVSLALPLLAGNILQQLYNTVDVTVAGRYVGEEAFAAVGVAGSVMNLFLFLITGCCNGVGALLSQSRGAGDPAAVYLRVIFLGFLPAFAYQLGFAVLRSVGNTAAALGFLMASMAANLALDLLFVAGLHWGIAGAAWATVLAQTLAAVCCQVYLRRRFSHLVFRRTDMGYDSRLLGRIVRFSLVSALHMCSLYVGKLLVQGTVNGLGAGAITAYTAATRVEGFANSFGDSGAASMSVFTGQNTGAGDARRSRAGFFTGERLLAVLGLVMSALMIAGAVPVLTLVLPEGSGEAVFSEARGYLRLVACFYLFNFLGSGMVGWFQGRGLVNLPAMGAAGHITVRVVLSALLAPRMGLPAVALATGLGWAGVVSVWSFPLRRDLRKAASES